MIVPTCSSRSARVRLPATRPLTTWTSSMCRAVFSTSRNARSTGSVAGPPSRSAAAVVSGISSADPCVRVGAVDAVDVLDDHEAPGAERVRDQERAGVAPVHRNAPDGRRKLVGVVGRVGRADDALRGREVDGELAADDAVVDVGDAVVGEQVREDAPVLAGFGGGQALEVADGQAEVEADAEDVAGADAGAGEDEQLVLRQDGRSSSTSGRIASAPRSMIGARRP